MKKRYVVYGWEEYDQKNYVDDYGVDFDASLEEGRLDVIDYGERQGEFDNEDDANACAMKYADTHRMYDIVSIYDREEKHWFN